MKELEHQVAAAAAATAASLKELSRWEQREIKNCASISNIVRVYIRACVREQQQLRGFANSWSARATERSAKNVFALVALKNSALAKKVQRGSLRIDGLQSAHERALVYVCVFAKRAYLRRIYFRAGVSLNPPVVSIFFFLVGGRGARGAGLEFLKAGFTRGLC